MFTSANPWYCASRAPESPTKPLESTSAIIVVRLVLMPSALDIAELQPVARIDMPYSVPKNQYSAAMMRTTNSSPVPTVRIMSMGAFPAVTYLEEMTSGNLSTLIGAFALPLMSR